MPPKYGGMGIPLSLHQLSQQRLELDPLQNRGAQRQGVGCAPLDKLRRPLGRCLQRLPPEHRPQHHAGEKIAGSGELAGSCLAIAKRMRLWPGSKQPAPDGARPEASPR